MASGARGETSSLSIRRPALPVAGNFRGHRHFQTPGLTGLAGLYAQGAARWQQLAGVQGHSLAIRI